MKFIIIGLGNFGSALAIQLTAMGHEVIGVDGSDVKVEIFKDVITQTLCLDSTNEVALKMLPLRECDYAIVAIGEDFGASVMTTALLKKAGVRHIIGRAISGIHQTVIEAIGVDLVLQPEKDNATRLAYRLVYSGVRDSYPVAPGYRIVEYQLPHIYNGLEIGEVDFIGNFRLQPITILRKGEEKSHFGKVRHSETSTGIITGNEILNTGDVVLLFGSEKAISDLQARG